MCMNCGCGQLDTRHEDSDIVRDDVIEAADGQGLSLDETVQNLEMALSRVHTEASLERQPTR